MPTSITDLLPLLDNSSGQNCSPWPCRLQQRTSLQPTQVIDRPSSKAVVAIIICAGKTRQLAVGRRSMAYLANRRWGHDLAKWRKSLRCTPGMWVIQQADRVVSHMMASPCPLVTITISVISRRNADGDADSLRTFGRHIPIILTAQMNLNHSGQPGGYPGLVVARSMAPPASRNTLKQLARPIGRAGWRHHHCPRKGASVARSLFAADRIWITRPTCPSQRSLPSLRHVRAHLSPTFSNRARRHSPAAYARIRMIEQACDLMRHQSKWSVSDIARHLGYSHTSAFVRAFRNELNTTPQRWQMSQQANS